jgi:hypothetical protein
LQLIAKFPARLPNFPVGRPIRRRFAKFAALTKEFADRIGNVGGCAAKFAGRSRSIRRGRPTIADRSRDSPPGR